MTSTEAHNAVLANQALYKRTRSFKHLYRLQKSVALELKLTVKERGKKKCAG